MSRLAVFFKDRLARIAMRISLIAILASLLAPAFAQGQAKLEWKFAKGDCFSTERVYTQKQVIDIKGKQFKQTGSNTWVTSVSIGDRAGDGHAVKFTIESVAYKTQGPAVAGGFDDKMAAKMKGAAFSGVITSQGRLTKLEGYEAFIGRLGEKNADVEKVLRSLLSEEGVREGFEEMFGFLPEKAVKVGDKWSRETVEPAPPFGSFKSAFEYTLRESKEAEHTIGFTIKMSYRPPADNTELFRVVKGALKAEEGRGTIVFDSERGRLIRAERSIHLRGDLVIETMGNQTPLEFTSDNTLTVRIIPK
jgi:Family of unknown function (DUF6263)